MALAVLAGWASENSDDKWTSLMEGVERRAGASPMTRSAAG